MPRLSKKTPMFSPNDDKRASKASSGKGSYTKSGTKASNSMAERDKKKKAKFTASRRAGGY